jgi:predicted nucleic acid-binding protein
MGEEPARTFHRFLESLDPLKIFDMDANHHQQVLRMLDRFRGSKLTYVDASSLALIEQYNIRQVWSTDHHLALTGAEILPRL